VGARQLRHASRRPGVDFHGRAPRWLWAQAACVTVMVTAVVADGLSRLVLALMVRL